MLGAPREALETLPWMHGATEVTWLKQHLTSNRKGRVDCSMVRKRPIKSEYYGSDVGQLGRTRLRLIASTQVMGVPSLTLRRKKVPMPDVRRRKKKSSGFYGTSVETNP